MELLYTQDLDAFCIASSDADFTPLIMQLKANGHDVYGFGARKTPAPFVNACTTFLYLESLDDPADSEPAGARTRPPRGTRQTATTAIGISTSPGSTNQRTSSSPNGASTAARLP